MENSNPKSDPQNQTGSDQNPNENTNPSNDVVPNRRGRTAFTELSQVDADLALARTLQEQERAYMMLRMENGGGGGGGGDVSDYGSWETESYGNEEVGEGDYSEGDYEGSDSEQVDAFDANAHAEVVEDDDEQTVELDPSAFSSDEAYARALQDAEDREMAARLLAMTGINGMVVGEVEDEEEEDDDDDDSEDNSQDPWEDVDPDELSYEELIALGDVVGTESRGLSAETISSLPSVNYKSQGNEEGSNDSCVICRLDYEDDETLTVLSCKHSYHTECIKNWLQINKVCPVCSTEVSTSSSVKSL